MGEPRAPDPILPLVGILGGLPWPVDLEERLRALLGRVSLRSPRWSFDATRYYEPEMGPDLQRGFLAFALRSPGELADWKLATQHLEQLWRTPGGRRVNLDPGYLTAHGLYLASTKPGIHRIYLRDGIYAEMTLRRVRGGWEPLPWTFPDFRVATYHDFLDACHASLCLALRDARPGRAG